MHVSVTNADTVELAWEADRNSLLLTVVCDIELFRYIKSTL